MIDTPKVMETVPQPAAVIRLTIPRAEIRSAMGPAVREVLAAVAAQGIAAAGPLFSHHFGMDPDVFDFEVGVPTAGVLDPQGRVVPGELPGGKVARTVYHGGHEGLPEAWGEFESWIAASGHRSGTDLWECYLSGQELPTRTELNRPLLATE